jgi:hypothetical protein
MATFALDRLVFGGHNRTYAQPGSPAIPLILSKPAARSAPMMFVAVNETQKKLSRMVSSAEAGGKRLVRVYVTFRFVGQLTVIVAQVEDGIGNESAFDQTEQSPRHVESGLVLQSELSHGDNGPAHHLDGDPNVRAKFLGN